MTHRARLSVLLVAGLLGGQWLAGTHLPEHSLQGSHDCAVCQFAQGTGAGALPSVPVVTLPPVSGTPAATRPQPVRTPVQRFHPIRGPPSQDA
ncbi:MAG TPA: hypothetical protein VM369_10255 [Candidatus Binatia bacterium]|nr:hypothetical protein [Candidatus Binatia bacterium]